MKELGLGAVSGRVLERGGEIEVRSLLDYMFRLRSILRLLLDLQGNRHNLLDGTLVCRLPSAGYWESETSSGLISQISNPFTFSLFSRFSFD